MCQDVRVSGVRVAERRGVRVTGCRSVRASGCHLSLSCSSRALQPTAAHDIRYSLRPFLRNSEMFPTRRLSASDVDETGTKAYVIRAPTPADVAFSFVDPAASPRVGCAGRVGRSWGVGHAFCRGRARVVGWSRWPASYDASATT